MLGGEDRGRGKECDLSAGFNRLIGGDGSHDGFAGADVPLKQTVHGRSFFKVLKNIPCGTLLPGSECERESAN